MPSQQLFTHILCSGLYIDFTLLGSSVILLLLLLQYLHVTFRILLLNVFDCYLLAVLLLDQVHRLEEWPNLTLSALYDDAYFIH